MTEVIIKKNEMAKKTIIYRELRVGEWFLWPEELRILPLVKLDDENSAYMDDGAICYADDININDPVTRLSKVTITYEVE